MRFRTDASAKFFGALVLIVLAAGVWSLVPNDNRAAAAATLGDGVVEHFRVVLKTASSSRLGPVHTLGAPPQTDALSLYEDDVWTAQANALGLDVVPNASGASNGGHAVGTLYLVRLRCGGVIYAFEGGDRRFDLGDRVKVQHGIAPKLTR